MFSVLPDVVISYLDCDSGSARRAVIIAFMAQGWHLALFDVPYLPGKSMPVQIGRYRLRLLTRMKRKAPVLRQCWGHEVQNCWICCAPIIANYHWQNYKPLWQQKFA